MQVKLLRVLQERKVRPLGGAGDVPVDVRLIASTNRDPQTMVASGQFREDFFYRVSVIPLHVPPLRERKQDIEPLARHFLQKFSVAMGKPLRDFDQTALSAMLGYTWPGNVRELENAIERAVALSSDDTEQVGLKHLPEAIRLHCLPTALVSTAPEGQIVVQIPEEGVDFEAHLAWVEKQYLVEALRAADGVRTRAAELLHMSYRSFRHYAKKHSV